MTLSQIRNQIDTLQRKYARELTICRLRRLAEQISDQWAVAVGGRQDPPQPHSIIRRVADAGFFLPIFMSLHQYLERNPAGEQGPCTQSNPPGPAPLGP